VTALRLSQPEPLAGPGPQAEVASSTVATVLPAGKAATAAALGSVSDFQSHTVSYKFPGVQLKLLSRSVHNTST
jgi:hypothetical protein